MEVISSIQRWREIFRSALGKRVGFVPTMGYLHQGHISLVERAKAENEVVAVSIFVNPTQFNNQEDLQCYPVSLDEDKRCLQELGVDYLLLPDYKELYGDDYRYKVSENSYSQDLCGAARPGHFDGVLTVVMKLLQITKASKAYFGQKDWQQYQLVKGMAQAFFLDTQIVGCPTVREDSGLALSSRNKLLTDEHRKIAPLLHQIIKEKLPLADKKKKLEAKGFRVDYLKEKEGRIFVAAFLGKVRLIDNVAI